MTILKGIKQGQKSSADITERLSRPWGWRWGLGGLGWVGQALTSADALFLSRQDARAVDYADALQDLIGQLGAHKSGRKESKLGSEPVRCRLL